MRDLAITFIVFASLPIIFRRPDVGVIVWTWLSLMSPHRLAWGFAVNMPFAQIVGFALLIGLLAWKEPKKIPWSPLVVVWIMFIVWMCVTTVFALYSPGAMIGWEKSMKIQIVSIIILMVMTTQPRLIAFVWTVALSIGFYGIKGGVFTITSGGSGLVYGPAGSFIAENNALAIATIVIVPLMRFLQLYSENKWVKRALLDGMVLCVFSILGSQSRGAFLAVSAMGLVLLLKSRRRVPMLIGLVMLIPVALASIPDSYWSRLETLETYEQDGSAMGRINAWQFAINLTKDRPIVGGGFGTFTPELFLRYAPSPNDYHDVHSIYFEILGEQGYVGLLLFLSLALLTYKAAGWTIRSARGDPDLRWHADLAAMCQVSMAGFAVGGAFLGLAYYDLVYDVVAIVVLNRLILQRSLAQRDATAVDSKLADGALNHDVLNGRPHGGPGGAPNGRLPNAGSLP